MSGLSCPACGNGFELPIAEASVEVLESELRRIKAALRPAASAPQAAEPASGGMASIWDRPKVSSGGWASSAEPSKSSVLVAKDSVFGSSGSGGDLRSQKERDALSSWGFTKRPSPEPVKASPKSELSKAPETSAKTGFGFGAGRKPRRPAVTATILTPVNPISGPAVVAKRQAPAAKAEAPAISPPKPRGPVGGPPPVPPRKVPAAAPAKPSAAAPQREIKPSTLLAALEAHPTVSPGQRATVKMIYDRFAPKATVAKGPADTDLSAALNADPNLNAGQRETLRTVVDRFSGKG